MRLFRCWVEAAGPATCLGCGGSRLLVQVLPGPRVPACGRYVRSFCWKLRAVRGVRRDSPRSSVFCESSPCGCSDAGSRRPVLRLVWVVAVRDFWFKSCRAHAYLPAAGTFAVSVGNCVLFVVCVEIVRVESLLPVFRVFRFALGSACWSRVRKVVGFESFGSSPAGPTA